MPTYRDEGVVLRTHKLGEADRIVTVLSHRHGKVRAVARGVRRTSSKFGARLEPFTHVDLQFASGRTLDVITEAVTLHPYSEPLGADYHAFTSGQVMLETADRLVSEEGQPSVHQFKLLVGALHALTHGTADGPRPALMVMDSYLLRAVAAGGFAPALSGCAVCGTPGPHESFSPSSGGVVCRGCRPPGSGLLLPPHSDAVGAVRITGASGSTESLGSSAARDPHVDSGSPGTLTYLQSLITGNWVATRDVTSGVQRQASGLIEAFVSWHLERGLRTLSYVDR